MKFNSPDLSINSVNITKILSYDRLQCEHSKILSYDGLQCEHSKT